MDRAPIRVGIAGLGYWGRKLLRTFQGLPSARVTALCDEDPGRCAELEGEYPGVVVTGDLDELAARDDVDAVSIVTPPSQHYAMARTVLAARKHVWVEKPLAMTTTDATALVALAQEHARVLFVDHTFLYDPMVTEMRRMIEAGDLGDIYHVTLQRLGMGRIRRDSDVWWNSAPHDLSILFHLVPRVVSSVRMTTSAHLQPDVADVAACDLELEGGTSAHIYLSWLHPEKTAKVVVVGSKRILTYEGRFAQRALDVTDYALDRSEPAPGQSAPIIPIEGTAARPVPVAEGGEPLTRAAEHFIDCIQTGTEPITGGKRMLPVVTALEEADRVAIRGGRFG